MPRKSYGEQVPEPTRFEALRGDFYVEPHDNHPGDDEVAGEVAGEDHWEWVGPENEAHISLRAEAIGRVPAMLAQLVETYDLLLDMSELGDIDCGPEWTDEEGEPDRAGRLLLALLEGISHTLFTLEARGERLGLDRFGVLAHTAGGYRPATSARFGDHAAAHGLAGTLAPKVAAGYAPSNAHDAPEYLAVPARLVDAHLPDEPTSEE